jgi:hypothetical protein
MKIRLTLLLLLLLSSFGLQAQYFWGENFEAPFDANRSHFIIDTVNYHHNIWQIGRPHKVVFDSTTPYSPPNVIVTDTVNHYPPNDTSVFIVKHFYMFSATFTFSFKYMLDIDTGTIIKVEISGDSGAHWINPITQDTTYQFYWGFGGKPRLDTSLHTWQNFQLGLDPWLDASPGGPYIFPHYRTSDTILFRFTFISNSDTVHKDGWMMDNFILQNAIMEGSVREVLDNNMVTVYPIPSNGSLYIHRNEQSSDKATFSIYFGKHSTFLFNQSQPAQW